MCVYLGVWMPVLHSNFSVRVLRFHGRLLYHIAFTHAPMTWRCVREPLLLAGDKASGGNWRVAVRGGSDCFIGLERDSVRPYHMWCIQTRDLSSICKNKKILWRGEEREGGGGRNPTPKDMSDLMPAIKSRCWRQNLKVLAQRTQKPLQDEEQWHCT
jgi:hypothetical protein